MPLRRSAATKVMVFQCPCGTRPIRRSPRGQRPLSRTILVLAAVSSTKTSRAGSNMPCSRIQRRRARATSARSCSAACRLFFESNLVTLKEAWTDQRAAARSSSPAAFSAVEPRQSVASTAVIWVKCFRQTGRCAAQPRGGSISPLEKHADFLLGLIEKQPDLTLDEVVLAMRKHKIAGSRTAVWRFFKRHKITFKKKPARSGARARGRGAGAPALDARTGHV